MSFRRFTTTARSAKALHWRDVGTTVPVEFYQRRVEAAIEALPPHLLAKVEVGIIQGNPHPTPANNDPEHVSGRIGRGNVSGKRRLSSFHVYPNGRVVFSDPKLAPFNKAADVQEASQAAHLPQHDFIWTEDDTGGTYHESQALDNADVYSTVIPASTPQVSVYNKQGTLRFLNEDNKEVQTNHSDWKEASIQIEGQVGPCLVYKGKKSGKRYYTWTLPMN